MSTLVIYILTIYPGGPIQYNKGKKRKGIQIGYEEVKLTVYMNMYVENTKTATTKNQ